MKDMHTGFEKLMEPSECALIANLASDPANDVFTKLAENYRVPAAEVQKAADAVAEVAADSSC